MIRRGYRYRLRPTPEQEARFQQFAGVCRLVYNLALEQRRDFWRQFRANTGNNITYVSQARELTQLRAEYDWIAAVSQTCQQQALRDLDMSFRRWFNGISSYPTPRIKGRNDSFRFQGREVQVRRLNAKWSEVWLPKVGWVRYRDTRPLVGKVANAVVSLAANGWHVSFSLEIARNTHAPLGTAVGVDRGIVNTLALSTSEMISVPPSLVALERRQRKAQRVTSRRRRGSRRYAKAQSRVAKIAARRARIRHDWHHRTTTELAGRFGTVVLEDLNTKGMTTKATGKRGLNRAILNQGWHVFETMLAYKLEERGGELVKVPARNTSRTCSACGHTDKRSRESQASFVCTACGHREHADTNAAINILRRSTALMLVDEPGCRSDEARTFDLGSSLLPVENPVFESSGGC